MSKEKNGKWENSHNYAKDWCALKIAKNFKNCETWEKLSWTKCPVIYASNELFN